MGLRPSALWHWVQALALNKGPTPSKSTRPWLAGVHSVIKSSRPGDTPPKALLGKLGIICKNGLEISAAMVALPPAGSQLISVSGLFGLSGLSGGVGGVGWLGNSGVLELSLLELSEASEPPHALSNKVAVKQNSARRMAGNKRVEGVFERFSEQ